MMKDHTFSKKLIDLSIMIKLENFDNLMYNSLLEDK